MSRGGFNRNETAILAHVPTVVQSGCDSTQTIYATELDSVHCVNAGQPDVDYSSFKTVADMNDAFAEDKSIADTTPTSKGTCSTGNYEATYTIGDKDAGKIRCMVVTGTKTGAKYKVIEWTHEPLVILSYMSSSKLSWPEMITFWQSQAGPSK